MVDMSHPMRKTNKCWKQRWSYATKANHVCAMDGMLKGDFVLPRQIMLVPHIVCKKMIL
jgi:hypothetical protein